MSWSQRLRRYVVMIVGVLAISMGVALVTKSATGTSAISVIPYTLSIALPAVSYGTYVAAFNALLVVLQALLLRKKANWIDLVQQLVLCFFFGSFVDLSMFLLGWFDPQTYPIRIVALLTGIVVLAFGAYLTLISHVGVMAGDGFSRALAQVSGRDFGVMRVASDSTMTATAVALNLVLFHALVCVREGTIVSALCTGFVVSFFNHHLKAFEYAILPANRETDQVSKAAQSENVPANNLIVTIAREYGSGGREVGRTLAEKLGIAFYDSELISQIAAESGYSTDFVTTNDQNVSNSRLARFYELYAGAVDAHDESQARRLFEADERVVRSVAAQGSCVIVGRLANWILRDHQGLFTVYLHANMADKVAHVVERDGLTPQEARAQVAKVEHERAEHCRLFTGQEWSDARNYDIAINTSTYGIEKTAEMLAAQIRIAREH